MSGEEEPGNTCQTNCTSRAAKFNFSTNPCSFHKSSSLVDQLLDASGFDTPTKCSIWDHVNFHLDQFCCWITQQRHSLTNWMSSSPATLACCIHLCVRSVFALVVARTVSILVFLGNCYSSPFVWSSLDPCSTNMTPTSSRPWTGSRSQRWAGNLGVLGYFRKKIEQIVTNSWLQNSCFSPLRGAKLFARWFALPDVILSISVCLKMKCLTNLQ